MFKIATISCIILAVSINFEGIQASVFNNNALGSILDNVRKQLEPEPFTTTDTNFGAVNDLINKLGNENNGLIQPTSILTCAKLVNEATTIIKKLSSNLDSCISSEKSTGEADIQRIKTLLSNLHNNITEEVKEIVKHSDNIIADIIKELPKLVYEQRSTIEEIISKILDLFTVVPSCFVSSYYKNVQQDVQQFIKDANECSKSIPRLF